MGAPSHPQMCGPWWREIPGRPGFTENSPFRLGPQQLTPYGRGVTSRAVFHYQRPLRNPLIDDGLFPRSCLRGHCKRTSQSAGTLGQNSPCPWSPSCHREGPPHLIIAVAELQGRLGKEEGWAMELKETEKLKEGELLFLQCAPLLTITASFLNGNGSGNHRGTNKRGLGSSWGKRLVLLILCRAGLGPLSYQPLTCPRLPVFTLFCLGPDFFDLAWIFCSGWKQSGS